MAKKPKSRAVSPLHNSGKRPRGKPFEKGKSGNPAGRPKGIKYLSEAYRVWLARPSGRDPGRTNADLVAEVIVNEAINGNIIAAKELADRTEGKPRQAIDLSVDERKRRLVEQAVEEMMRECEMDRDQAEEELLKFVPEARQWIN
jgi:hypothetical protein